MTVDRTHVLATPGLDAHATYVALSRHRTGTALHYGRDDFADEQALRRTLARERPKDMALDYDSGTPTPQAQSRAASAASTAARYFEQGGERMLASILGTLAPAIGNLRYMARLGGEPFSIRRWIRGQAGSLWMPYAANQVAALRGLVSCWMNIAILETLSLPPSRDRRIWFHIDELDALGRIEGLKDAQARLRKFGGCVAIGFQSFAQVKAVYGEGAHTIIENCGNLLLLRAGASDGGGTAKLASDLIGDREVERNDVSRSRTRGRFTSQSTSMQTKRTVEDAALASEIMQLGNREGYLKRATSPRWLRVTFPYTNYALRTRALENPMYWRAGQRG